MSRLLTQISTFWLSCLFCLLALGCQASSTTETASFEQAEVAYRAGQYSRALDGYQGFLKRYPKSPLASVARTRIRCISREIRGLKGRKGVPLPIYKGGSSVSAANQPDKSPEVKPDRPASPSVR